MLKVNATVHKSQVKCLVVGELSEINLVHQKLIGGAELCWAEAERFENTNTKLISTNGILHSGKLRFV